MTSRDVFTSLRNAVRTVGDGVALDLGGADQADKPGCVGDRDVYVGLGGVE